MKNIVISIIGLFLLGTFAFKAFGLKDKTMLDDDLFFNESSFTVAIDSLVFDKNISIYSYNNIAFSGTAIEMFSNGDKAIEYTYLKGKKHGVLKEWYSDGHIKSETSYRQGRLNGTKKFWSSDSLHLLVEKLSFENGKAHGEQAYWYESGEKYKLLNMNQGRQEGLQKAFRKNGKLYANYEAKDGRIYGMKKTNLCYTLEDEKIIVSE